MIMTIRIISNFFFGWLSPNNTYGYPPMFPINPSCWWLNTAFLALLAPTACISPGFTIRIAAWHSSLVTSPYQYLRHGGSWATQRHESWKILHVFCDHFIPFDAVLWSGTSSLWIYMAIFCRQIELSEICSKKTNVVSHKKSPILQPGIDMLERSRTMTWLRKVDPPVQNNKSMMGFQVFCACYFDVCSIDCWFSH